MEQLAADWTTIQGHLAEIPGLDSKGLAQLKAYYEEGEAKKGIHFFLIQYAAGEVIMAKGTTSDYAAIHLQGRVRVRDVAMPMRTAGPGCWDQPWRRRLETIVARQAAQWPTDQQPTRGWLGWLGPLYRAAPSWPVRMIDFCERWLPQAAADRVRRHVARVLHGRLPPVRRLERELSDPGRAQVASPVAAGTSNDFILTVRDANGARKPIVDRILGITGTLWNQPRSVTLIADNDPDDADRPCLMLLIKRKALEEIIKRAPQFYEQKMAEFVRTTLPDLLARNRLFRDRLFVEDVRDWQALLEALKGTTEMPTRLARLREHMARRLPWLAKTDADRLDAAEKSQIVEGLNYVLTRQEITAAELRATVLPPDVPPEIVARASELNDCEKFWLNRTLLEAALPGVLAKSPRPFPLTREEFRAFTKDLVDAHQRKFGTSLQPLRLENKDRKSAKKGVTVFRQGDPADALYLILSGMARVQLDLPGGQSMINNLEADSYFGESAVLDDAPDGQGPPRRTAAVETLCSTTLLKLDRDVLRQLFAGAYGALGAKLRRERALLAQRDEQMRTGRLLPPHEPPRALADKLMLTRNILLIDMEKCTRCDQCVRGCADLHDGQPRFHRANPAWRFGKWEAAGACMHCFDAPCQEACPVGAITWLENGAVQIHRDRCIGCSQCAADCPFEVIEMAERLSPSDAPSTKKKRTESGEPIVATKCDLCLTDEYDPACVAYCPYDAAQRVDPVTFFPDLKSWANFPDRR